MAPQTPRRPPCPAQDFLSADALNLARLLRLHRAAVTSNTVIAAATASNLPTSARESA